MSSSSRSILFLSIFISISTTTAFPFFPFPGFGRGDETSESKLDFETNFLGSWAIDNPNSGVSAMQAQLLPNNKVILYDNTNLGPSGIKLQPEGNCRLIPKGATNKVDKEDCWAHAIEYNALTSEFRTLKVVCLCFMFMFVNVLFLRKGINCECSFTDSWCSSGGVLMDGSLISTGGFRDGQRAVRFLSPCSDCDWQENPQGLSVKRWYNLIYLFGFKYSTQEKLEDGSFVVVGGRGEYSYEFVKGDTLENEIKSIDLPFLLQTKDLVENNLYPFVYLLPDGSLFIFANNRAITIDPQTGKTLRYLPTLPGGSRNYPASGMSALLPLKVTGGVLSSSPEVLVCGGNTKDAFTLASKRIYSPALLDCGRIRLSDAKPKWEIEMMPSRRVMGDMLILPNAELLILNGAKMGSSGWRSADEPNLRPVVYNPDKKAGNRFKEMNPTDIPRMYHSSSAVLPDGKILVAGSNTNPTYDFLNQTKFKTELRVEKFTPHYLDPILDKHRPEISELFSQSRLRYGRKFSLAVIMSDMNVDEEDLKVTMLSPPFTTHGYSHNQRMVVLDVIHLVGSHLTVTAPPNARIAPPGYYLLHVVHRGVPSKGMWVRIH
ncbi:LOW QUALITY PROTEIN: putative aldehyde oxidase Art an 7 [Impatiens glandulifera]|uniref:LOW QUALITY PROTEIN: putative aldehyde oxidase Art an 7 n=1 Tax=Impatiens glandulifera TaxID=253017 RepID=UPI001FB14067|nr:LOW QUALITY PROTEIN: putative aldehyde oxidase Art an 7 [Impatiens glandulifera]